MYTGGESACDMFGALNAVTSTIFNLPVRMTNYTISIFTSGGNGEDNSAQEPEHNGSKQGQTHRPFASGSESDGNSHGHGHGHGHGHHHHGKKSHKQVKLALDQVGSRQDQLHNHNNNNSSSSRSTASDSTTSNINSNSHLDGEDGERDQDDVLTEQVAAALMSSPDQGHGIKKKQSMTFMMPESPSLRGPHPGLDNVTSPASAISLQLSNNVADLTEQSKHIVIAYYNALNAKNIPAAVSHLDTDVVVIYQTNDTKNYTGASVAAERYRALYNTLPAFHATITFLDVNCEGDAVAFHLSCHIECSKTGLDRATDMVFVVKSGKIVLIEHKA
jgi:ketosteroid isomerase-like protein